jgi:N-acetylglucosaminyldiphosphoundecaprenol N-acetyl-beta-D-mannosaminyltransferase
MERIVLLYDIPVDSGALPEHREHIRSYLAGDEQRRVVTPNPEMFLRARNDRAFRECLQGADLSLPDGAGLLLVSMLRGRSMRRMTGTDFIPTVLVPEAVAANASIFFLGAKGDIASRAARHLQRRFPSLRVSGAEGGGLITQGEEGWRMDAGLLTRIRTAGPDILLVALGHGKQEFWIRDHLPGLPSVKIAIGCGGALDYLSGHIGRAPQIVRAARCEWLWRVIREPRRFPRIIDAVIKFPIIALYDITTKKNTKEKTTTR